MKKFTSKKLCPLQCISFWSCWSYSFVKNWQTRTKQIKIFANKPSVFLLRIGFWCIMSYFSESVPIKFRQCFKKNYAIDTVEDYMQYLFWELSRGRFSPSPPTLSSFSFAEDDDKTTAWSWYWDEADSALVDVKDETVSTVVSFSSACKPWTTLSKNIHNHNWFVIDLSETKLLTLI